MKFMGGDKSISRQRRWQLRQKKAGKCVLCPKDRVSLNWCLDHMIKLREYQRSCQGSKRRNKMAKSYKLERN